MASETGAEVVIVGTGVIGAVIAEQLLDEGHSVLMIEAGPRVSRAEIVENFRNVPLGAKGDTSASYPPRPWAPHPVADDKPEDQYLQLTGPIPMLRLSSATPVARPGTGRAPAGG